MEDFDFTYDVTNSAYNTLPFPTVKDPASIDFILNRYENLQKVICLIVMENACHGNDLYITNIF